MAFALSPGRLLTVSLMGRIDDELIGGPPATSPADPARQAARRAAGSADANAIQGLSRNEQLQALVRDHGDAVYRVALSVTRNRDAAEDVAQEALLKAWTALPTFRGEAPLRSWLLRIVHNTAISSLRGRREDPADPTLMPESPSGSVAGRRSAERAPDAEVEGSMSMRAFEAALAELDGLSRSIVVLREVEGMSYEQIAELLDVPLPTVKTRLLRSRRVLAAALEGWRR